jgi:hypothetical protein
VLSRQNPVLMIFEDVHWTDPTSLEAFGRAVDRFRTLRVLLIVTFRPEFEPPWIGRHYVTALSVNRLAQRDIEAMIDHVVGNKLIPASVRQDIIERTDGIPLFVEEMTKAVLEAEGEGDAQQTAGVPSPAIAVPASLHASLMARLDRLGSAKEVTDRRGYWAPVLSCPAGCDSSHASAGTSVGAGPSSCGGIVVPAGGAALCELLVQARAGTGCGLRHAPARAATRAARSHR